MSKAKNVADLVQEAIEKGATTAEDVHKAIANLPLKILEELEPLKKPIKEVRRVQDHSIGAVYDLIREINRRVGKLASEALRQRPPAPRGAKASRKKS
jgi:hypothetical protein